MMWGYEQASSSDFEEEEAKDNDNEESGLEEEEAESDVKNGEFAMSYRLNVNSGWKRAIYQMAV